MPFRIIPGISAGLGGLAYAGIPLTHRSVNSTVTFVTGHGTTGAVPETVDWAALSRGSPVIVFYMALRRLDEIRARLMDNGRAPDEPVAVVSAATTEGQRVVETTCSFCGVGCGLTAHVRGEKITHIDSPDDHPVNQGWLCVKGRYGWDYVQHEDRRTHPLFRAGARGDGRWRQASWDEALDLVAERLAEKKARHQRD